MRLDSTMFRPVALLLAVHILYAPVAPLDAQTFVTPTGEAQNVRFEQRDSGVVEIFYDLIANDARAVFSVVVEGSQDSGATWDMRPKTMTGDVGAGIRPGVGKKIVWDAGKDVERIQFNSLRFRMVATGGPLAANPAKPTPPANTTKPTPTATTAKPTPPANPAKPTPAAGGQTAVNKPAGGGGGGKNKLLIIGGVAAAGAAAAVLVSGSKSAAPTVTNSSITGNNGTLLAGVVTLTFRVSVSNPENESLTASWNFGDGTTGSAAISGGQASVTKVYGAAGTFSPTVTINGGHGGTGTGSYPTVTVASLTGRWLGVWTTFTGATATLNLTQTGTNVTGDVSIVGTNFTNPGRVTGTVNSAGTVAMDLIGPTGGGYAVTVTGPTPYIRFEGVAVGAVSNPWVMTKQ